METIESIARELEAKVNQLREENANLKEALRGSLEIIQELLASKRIVNLDEAIAYYEQLLTH